MALAPYKRAAFLLCACNSVTVLCILYIIFRPFSYKSSAYSVQPSWRLSLGSNTSAANTSDANTSAVEAARIEEALKARKALEPVKLIKRVKEIQDEVSRDSREKNGATGQKRNVELAGRLKQLKKTTVKKNQQALEEWRKKKLDIIKATDYGSNTTDST